jgi:hypothetical protein
VQGKRQALVLLSVRPRGSYWFFAARAVGGVREDGSMALTQ